MYLWCFYLRVTSPLYGLQIPQCEPDCSPRSHCSSNCSCCSPSGVSVHLEPKIDGEDSSRGDGHLFFHAQSAIFDTLVIDPCAKSYVKAAQFLLGAATTGETRKCDLYDERCRRQDYLFFPVAIETFGGMGVRGRDLIMKIDEEGKLNGVRHIHGMRIKTFLQRAISFTTQSGNAHLAMHGSKRSRKRLV